MSRYLIGRSSGLKALGFCVSCILLAACSGGGSATGSDPALNEDCKPGLLSGFSGDFNDQITNVISEGEGGSPGGSGEGSPGIGAGGSLGQFRNVSATVSFSSGETFGPVRVGADKGMVTLVPCNLQAPALVTLLGESGSGATYFDEALNRDVPFEGRQIRSIITDFSKNAGVTTFTEAMVRRAETIGQEQSEGEASSLNAADAWRDSALVERAHGEVLTQINRQLPGVYRLDDLRRLPVILNGQRIQPGSNALTDDQNGRYGAALAGLVAMGAANRSESTSPALEINDQFADDLADGRLDLTNNGASLVAADSSTSYTYETFWDFQTLGTTRVAQQSGVGILASTELTLATTTLELTVTDPVTNDQSIGLTYTLAHSSSGDLTFRSNRIGCPLFERVIPNVRQVDFNTALSQDGLSVIRPKQSANPCEPVLENPFELPGGVVPGRLVSINNFGDLFRASDGRFYVFSVQRALGDQFFELRIDGPRSVAMEKQTFFLWTLTERGTLVRHFTGSGALTYDPNTDTVGPIPGTGIPVELPNPVIQLEASGDNRETFALTSAGSVYWLRVNDVQGRRLASMPPNPVLLPVENICSISRGVIAVACDGSYFHEITPVSDTSLPPITDVTDASGRRILVPEVSGVLTSARIQAATPIWRSTDSAAPADGSVSPVAFSSAPRLLGVNGSVRTIGGDVVAPASN